MGTVKGIKELSKVCFDFIPQKEQRTQKLTGNRNINGILLSLLTQSFSLYKKEVVGFILSVLLVFQYIFLVPQFLSV